ncbi:MAG TPA: hypothetical protein GXX17_05545 [Clostridiales bacterium]|nr:hypothetical protein [Clostridiales bacterium]
MPDNIPYFGEGNNTEEMNAYFNSLPKYVQETIKQSAGEIKDQEELKKLAENLMRYE